MLRGLVSGLSGDLLSQLYTIFPMGPQYRPLLLKGHELLGPCFGRWLTIVFYWVDKDSIKGPRQGTMGSTLESNLQPLKFKLPLKGRLRPIRIPGRSGYFGIS